MWNENVALDLPAYVVNERDLLNYITSLGLSCYWPIFTSQTATVQNPHKGYTLYVTGYLKKNPFPFSPICLCKHNSGICFNFFVKPVMAVCFFPSHYLMIVQSEPVYNRSGWSMHISPTRHTQHSMQQRKYPVPQRTRQMLLCWSICSDEGTNSPQFPTCHRYFYIDLSLVINDVESCDSTIETNCFVHDA